MSDPCMHTSYRKVHGRHEHRIVMEQMIGRSLTSDDIVHHRDGTKRNNAPENLQLTDRVEHGRIHNLGNRYGVKTVCKNGHLLTDGNIQMMGVKRRCLICYRAYSNEWQKAKRRAMPPRPDKYGKGKRKSPAHCENIRKGLLALHQSRRLQSQEGQS